MSAVRAWIEYNYLAEVSSFLFFSSHVRKPRNENCLQGPFMFWTRNKSCNSSCLLLGSSLPLELLRIKSKSSLRKCNPSVNVNSICWFKKKGMATIDDCGSCAVVALNFSSGLPFPLTHIRKMNRWKLFMLLLMFRTRTPRYPAPCVLRLSSRPLSTCPYVFKNVTAQWERGRVCEVNLAIPIWQCGWIIAATPTLQWLQIHSRGCFSAYIFPES
jgi:hypothetical protein